MSADIYLYLIISDPKEADEKFRVLEDGTIKWTDERLPERLRPYLTKIKAQKYAVRKELIKRGYNLDDVADVNHDYEREATIIKFRDGREIVLEWKDLEVYDVYEDFLLVKTVMYLEFRYLGNNWSERTGSPFFSEEARKYIKEFYWSPEDMDVTDIIFNDRALKRWKTMKQEFKRLLRDGKPAFVWASW